MSSDPKLHPVPECPCSSRASDQFAHRSFSCKAVSFHKLRTGSGIAGFRFLPCLESASTTWACFHRECGRTPYDEWSYAHVRTNGRYELGEHYTALCDFVSTLPLFRSKIRFPAAAACHPADRAGAGSPCERNRVLRPNGNGRTGMQHDGTESPSNSGVVTIQNPTGERSAITIIFCSEYLCVRKHFRVRFLTTPNFLLLFEQGTENSELFCAIFDDF